MTGFMVRSNGVMRVLLSGIQDSLGFWISFRGLWIPGAGFQSFSVERGFWIPFLSGISEYLSSILDSKAPEFRIPRAKCLGVLDSTNKNFPDSRIRTPLHGASTSQTFSDLFTHI